MSLLSTIEGTRVLVCVGSGGVGKTTTAAAIALRAARDGAKVCVITIDPARRLANALGLEELGNIEKKIDSSTFTESGLEEPQGSLHALMLDTKRTWDELVNRYAPDPEAKQRILDNSFYKQISSALTGSHEFMAMEKVYELQEENRYDLLVVDTPPTKHALDFLDAPQKMINFMDEDILKWFLKPASEGVGFGLRVLGSSGAWVMKLLERITGLELLRDLSEFFESFRGMYRGFIERAEAVQKLMREDTTRFVLVTSPDPHTLDDARFFFEKLDEYGLSFSGFVFNKMHADYLATDEAKEAFRSARNKPQEILAFLEASNRSEAAEAMASRLADNLAGYQLLAEADRADTDRLAEVVAGGSYTTVAVPYLDEDVHDLRGLARIGEHLFGPRTTPMKKTANR